ncbi:hypothetical protein B6U98_01365 [Thermoplasmatales archaeon ex4572_165]|nr:MAG: hypothetical protein B6U98_01365 [Thermoplasmatales archaeon ex4572_165]
MIRKIRIIGIICIIFFYLILNLNPIIANNFSTNQSSINDLNEDSEDFNIAKNLHFTYHFPNPKITINESENNFQHDFFIEKLPTTSKDGGNNFPFKELVILLPQNHIYESYSQLIDNTVLEYDSINTVKKLNQEIFPTEPIKINGNACYRGYSLLFVTIYPIYYDTKLENIIFANEISFSVETTEICDENSLFRDSTEDMQGIIKQIENPLMNTTYHKQMLNPTLQNDDSSDDIYKYVIITSNELEEYFNNFVAYKNNFISTRTMNLSYINSNFYGRDLQERIRESIRYAYQNWNTEYVLLGGDVNIIPYRGLFGKAIDHKGELLIDYDIPADIYYASLDGTWDDDGDGIYGEDQLNSICDEADLIAEVYVGRAPVENKAEVATFTNKVISFETSPKPKKILLHQSGVNTANDPDSTVIPEKISNWIPSDYEVDKLYQVNQVITIDDWKSAFEDNNFIIQHTGNGEEDQYYIDYPLQTFSVFQSLTLNNEFYPIHTSVSCHSGAFDNDDCLAETLILNPYGGASACLFNSRWGFTSENNIHKYSGELIERQFYELFWKNVSNLGKIHQFAKEYYYIDAMIDPAYRWCYYTLNLLGDPETPVQQTRQYSFKTTDFFVDDDYDNKIDGWNITHFNSIQASIDAASELDTIHVMNGIYNERF